MPLEAYWGNRHMCGSLVRYYEQEVSMRFGFFALALTAFVAFSAAPAFAECAGHPKTAEKPSQSTVAGTTVKQSTPTGG